MGLDEFIKYNKIVYGVIPKISKLNLIYFNGESSIDLQSFLKGNLSNKILYFGRKVNVLGLFVDNSNNTTNSFSFELDFLHVINLIKYVESFGVNINDLDHNQTYLCIYDLTGDYELVEGNMSYNMSLNGTIGADIAKLSGDLPMPILSRCALGFIGIVYLLEYDPNVQLW